MKSFFCFCFAFFTFLTLTFAISEHPVLAQGMDMDEPIVIYSEPQIVSGDPNRCKMDATKNGSNMAITFLDAAASSGSQGLKRDFLKCRVEMDVTVQLKEGWYFYAIENSVIGAITQSPKSTAAISIRSTFKKKPVLRIKETKSVPLGGKDITRSNSIPVSFAWSKAEQCSGDIQNSTGKIVLNLTAQTQNDAQAKLDGFDIYAINARCDS